MDASFLGSELACHIRDYGRWLIGEPQWKDRCFVSAEAQDRKTIMILLRARAAMSVWHRLSERIRRRHRSRIRRDVQRLTALQNGRGPAPRGLLDAAWEDHPRIEEWWAQADLPGLPPPFWGGDPVSAAESASRP